MKFGTDMDEYGKWFCKYFKVCQTEECYLHCTYILTLYHNNIQATRDVVIVTKTLHPESRSTKKNSANL